MLDTGNAEKALSFIQKHGAHSPEFKNALGVCLLRLGRVEHATEVLRDLVFQKFICIPRDTPPVFQANYATALLLKKYNQMATEIIRSLPVSAHPYIAELRRCIDQWQQKLPLHQRLLCRLNSFPDAAIELPMPPGVLFTPSAEYSSFEQHTW
jgi:hypothetical protein